MLHTIPMVVLGVEFIFDQMPFYVTHSIIGLIVIILYGLCVNLVYVKVTG